MKRLGIFLITAILLVSVMTMAQTTMKPAARFPVLTKKIWIKVLVRHTWDNERQNNSTLVVLKEGSQAGAVILGAKVSVNGYPLAFDPGIQEYKGNIGTISPGQKVPVQVAVKDGRQIKGYVTAGKFLVITQPTPFTLVSPAVKFTVKWAFSDHNIYSVVFKVLRVENQLFSTTVNSDTYKVKFDTMGVAVNHGELIRLRVISPWSSIYKFTGDYAPGSLGQFFATATVTVRIK